MVYSHSLTASTTTNTLTKNIQNKIDMGWLGQKLAKSRCGLRAKVLSRLEDGLQLVSSDLVS